MQVKIIGVELADANAMALSLHHGERVVLERVGGFADGIAVKKVGEETFRICRELIDGVVLVNRDAICASIKVRSDFESQINIVFQILSLFDQVPIHLSIRLVFKWGFLYCRTCLSKNGAYLNRQGLQPLLGLKHIANIMDSKVKQLWQ